MNLPRYPEYKPSGVEWLGEVPKHWDAKRLKFSVFLINEKVESQETDLEYMGLEHIESWSGRRIDDENANSDGIAARFLPQDVLFGKLRPYLAKVYLAEHEGLVSTEALVIRSNDHVHPMFLRYYMVSRDFIRTVDSSTYGSKMPRAGWDFIGNLPILLPHIEEQQTIARFLDHKTAQIDALIAKKKALLEKLAEKRTALISHAVTKGLDPQVKMKDSGVEWLGQVPEHWKVKRLRFCVSMNPSKNEINLTNDSIVSFVPMDAVGEYGGLRLDEEKELSDIGGGYTYFANDDVVVAKITPCFENGKGAIAKELANGVAFGTTELHVIRADDEIFPEYLFHLTMSYPFRMIGESEMYGAGGQKRIPENFIKDFRIGLPPLDEQENIVEYINESNGLSQRQLEKATAAIEKLKEYRSALITQAVTGKIDVRNVKIPEATAKGQAA